MLSAALVQNPVAVKVAAALRAHQLGHIKIGPERLAGGVISHIFEGTDTRSETPVVLKFTEDRTNEKEPFNPRIDHFISRAGHNLDAQILVYLAEKIDPKICIFPAVLHHLPDEFITIMPDLRKPPYEMVLLSTNLSDGVKQHGFNLGRALAHTQFHLAQSDFEPNETAKEQFEERGQGLLIYNQSDQVLYRRFLDENTASGNPLVPTDAHPKNIFYGTNDSFSLIDWGRTTHGDPEFPLPNSLSHIIMNYILDRVDSNGESAIKFIKSAIAGYQAGISELQGKPYVINQEKFCFYVAAEVFNRCNGKWVDYLSNTNPMLRKAQAAALREFAEMILIENIQSVDQILELAKHGRGRIIGGWYAWNE